MLTPHNYAALGRNDIWSQTAVLQWQVSSCDTKQRNRDAGLLQAIEFVQMQQDDELWDLLITLALAQPPLTGGYALTSHCSLVRNTAH